MGIEFAGDLGSIVWNIQIGVNALPIVGSALLGIICIVWSLFN